MLAFRALLIGLWVVLLVYTGVVISRDGMGLLPVFFGDILKIGWPGQFNLDFLFMLCLSALWTGWRNRFSASGLALSVVAFFGGYGFLGVYLLWLSFREDSIEGVLLGMRRS